MGRITDDIEGDSAQRQRRYGGGPSPLADPKTLERAKRLLADGQTARTVAGQVGYSSFSAFSNAFLSATGKRPSAYAKSVGAKPKRGIRSIGPRLRARRTWDKSHKNSPQSKEGYTPRTKAGLVRP